MAMTFKKPEGAKVVGGAFDGPSWCPHYADYNEKRQAELLQKHNDGSFVGPAIRGELVIFEGWGRKLYGVRIEGRWFHVPEHQALYNALNRIKVGAEVYIEATGTAKKSKPGQQAARIYDVLCPNVADVFDEARPDALTIKRSGDQDAMPADPREPGDEG